MLKIMLYPTEGQTEGSNDKYLASIRSIFHFTY